MNIIRDFNRPENRSENACTDSYLQLNTISVNRNSVMSTFALRVSQNVTIRKELRDPSIHSLVLCRTKLTIVTIASV